MLASTSTNSSALAATASKEGIKHLYRTILQQARLLSSTFDDPIIFSSHRYLARANLQPLLIHSLPHPCLPCLSSTSTHGESVQWPPSTASKRILRAKTQRRHLADANYGWEHSVFRSLSLAYARSGKLRRDALSDFSPQRSTSPSEAKYPKELRKKQFSPVLLALLTNPASMEGAAVKNVAHLTTRPPPPFLPSEDDPVVKFYGKARGRRRVANAEKKFVKTYMRKIKLPLDVVVGEKGEEASMFRYLESKAKPVAQYVVNNPNRTGELGRGEEEAGGRRERGREKPYLISAKNSKSLYRSNMNPSEHRKEALRRHGWDSHPKDYTNARRKKRLYGRLLDDVPLLLLPCSTPCSLTLEGRRGGGKDPLGIRSKLKSASTLAKGKIRILKSTHSISPTNQRYETLPSSIFGESKEEADGLNFSEKDFLREMGML